MESFGTLDVEIHTPYALQESQPEDFRQEKGGYGLELPGLPEGELEFVLYSAEKPAAESTAGREQGLCFGSCRSVSVLLSERLQFFWCFSG